MYVFYLFEHSISLTQKKDAIDYKVSYIAQTSVARFVLSFMKFTLTERSMQIKIIFFYRSCIILYLCVWYISPLVCFFCEDKKYFVLCSPNFLHISCDQVSVRSRHIQALCSHPLHEHSLPTVQRLI